MPKKPDLTSTEPTKLQRFEKLDERFQSLTQQRLAVEAEIAKLNAELKAKYRGWPKVGEFRPKPAAPPKQHGESVLARVADVLDLKPAEPAPQPEVQARWALVDKINALQAEKQDLLDAAGLVLHQRFEAQMDASEEVADKLAPETDTRKARIANAMTELMDSLQDWDAYIREKFESQRLSYLFVRALPVRQLDSLQWPAVRFLEAAVEQGFADRSVVQRLREFKPLQAPPLRPSDHPRLNIRR